MTGITYNNPLQMAAITDNGSDYPGVPGSIRELNMDEIESVSGGGFLDPAITGFTVGGAIGGVIGAAVTGGSFGFNSFGAFGASIGFSFGLGWGAGSFIYKHMVSR